MKLACVVQRYGSSIIGGAEAHCRNIALRLRAFGDVEILTTCAHEYSTWKNVYEPGSERLDGLTVRRFPVKEPRVPELFDKTYDFLGAIQRWRLGYYDQKLRLEAEPLKHWWQDQKVVGDVAYYTDTNEDIGPLNRCSWAQRLMIYTLEALVQRFWMYTQGPYSPALTHYVRQHRYQYDAFVFFSYGYASTYYAFPYVCDRALLVPTAHDDPSFRFRIYKPLFHKCRSFMFNTQEEQDLVESVYPKTRFAQRTIVGLGFEIWTPPPSELLAAKQTFVLDKPFILYVGRLDEFKGTNELFSMFARFKFDYPSDLELCLIGPAPAQSLSCPQMRSLGVLSDADKAAVMAQAQLVVLPSPFESLSMVMLEALSLKVPVLANGRSPVLVGQCQRAAAGLIYMDYESFVKGVQTLWHDRALAAQLGENGQRFVWEHYRWSHIDDKYKIAIQNLGVPWE